MASNSPHLWNLCSEGEWPARLWSCWVDQVQSGSLVNSLHTAFLDNQTNAVTTVIQLAKASGLSPIITTSSLKHTDFLKSLGATHVLNRNISARLLRGEIDKITTVPIEYVYDAISSQETQQAGHDILVSGGQLVLVLSQNIKKADDKTVTQVFAVSTLPKNRENLVHMCSKLTELLEDGVIVVCSAFFGEALCSLMEFFISRVNMRHFLVG